MVDSLKSEPTKYICPHCQYENIQALSLYYEADTRQIDFTTVGGGVTVDRQGVSSINGNTSLTSGAAQSLLAKRIAPPERTDEKYRYHSLWIRWVCAISPFVIVFFMKDLSVAILLGVILVLLMVKDMQEAKVRKAKTDVIFQRDLDEWKSSWICGRCGFIFKLDA